MECAESAINFWIKGTKCLIHLEKTTEDRNNIINGPPSLPQSRQGAGFTLAHFRHFSSLMKSSLLVHPSGVKSKLSPPREAGSSTRPGSLLGFEGVGIKRSDI